VIIFYVRILPGLAIEKENNILNIIKNIIKKPLLLFVLGYCTKRLLNPFYYKNIFYKFLLI